MNIKLNDLSKEVLRLAQEKGWGHTHETFDLSKKLLLIQTEITEIQEILLDGQINTQEKDTLDCELADVIIRSLHMAAIFKVDLDKELLKTKTNIENYKNTKDVILSLYKTVTQGYEAYRKNNERAFLETPVKITKIVFEWSDELNIDIEKAIFTKLEINKTRSWKNLYKLDKKNVT